jgi:hypothetical protein
MTRLSRFAIGMALAFCAISVLGRDGRAASATLCDQKVGYSIAPLSADLSPQLRNYSGVWTGSVKFALDAEMCVAMVVEAIKADGTIDTRFAWSVGSDTGILNMASFGTAPWSGKVEHGVLRLVGSQNGNTYTYEFHLNGGNELAGYFAQNTHRTPLLLKRR